MWGRKTKTTNQNKTPPNKKTQRTTTAKWYSKRCVLGIELEAKNQFTNDVEEEEEDEALHRVVQNKCQTGGHLALERRVFQNGVLVFTLNERVYLFTFRYTSDGIQDFWFLAWAIPSPVLLWKNVGYCHGKSVFKKITRKRKHVFKHIFYREKQKYRGHIFISHACKTITLWKYIFIFYGFSIKNRLFLNTLTNDSHTNALLSR